MWVVLLVVLLDIVGFGIIIPIFPFYASKLGAGPELVMLCIALYSGSLFIATPFLGKLSDLYGRKPIMAVGLLGAVGGYLMLAFVESIWLIALSRIVSGLMAGNMSAAQAYITDKTNDDERAKYMGLFGAMLGLGFVVGPALGSWMGGDSFENANFIAPALTAAGLSLLAFFAVLFFVEESHPAEKRQAQEQPERLLHTLKTLRGRGLLLKVIICGALYQVAAGFYEAIFPLWAADRAILEGPRDMLPMLLASGLTYVLVMATLIDPLTKRFSHRHLLQWSSVLLVTVTCGVVVAGDAKSALGVTVFMALISACAGVIITCTQTLVSQCAKEHERGVILGFASSAGTLGRTFSTALSGVIYGQVHYHSPYFAAILVGVLLLWVASQIRSPEGLVAAQSDT